MFQKSMSYPSSGFSLFGGFRVMRSIMLVFVGAIFVAGCAQPYVLRSKYDRDIDTANESIEALRKRNQELETKLAQENYSKLEAERYEKLLAELRASLQNIPGVKVTESGLELEDQVFFELGRAEIKSQGKKILKQISLKLKDMDTMIKIVGHTDDHPIKECRKRYHISTNLELGMLRAKNVMLEFLSGGIPETKMLLESDGENRPCVPNTTPANKSKNRRVEIFFLKK